MRSIQITRRLALASCTLFPQFHPDDAHLVRALRDLGVEPVSCIWNDPAVDWTAFDAVLIRATWDYFMQYAAFQRWLAKLPVPTINDAQLLRWNSDKRYLLDLEQQGIAVIPTLVASATDLRRSLVTLHGREVVVKPTVSGGAWHTLRGVVGESAFEQAVAQLPQELDYMVQAFVPEVVSKGEWSLLFFDGQYSHAVLKRAAAGDYRVQGSFGGSTEFIDADPSIIASAQRALDATTAIGHRDQAYARVDGVVVDGRFLLMELEMIEPLLFLEQRPEAAERFAGNLRRRLDALADTAKG
jgi:glutathione synthase/RimK-type ligase-like ATP-grasp enzyme